QARWNANATYGFEIMSGGFTWSDERLWEVAQLCAGQNNWAFRYVIGDRASLSRGAPRESLRVPWDQLLAECPDWLGFRPQRSSPTLAKELDAESERSLGGLDDLDQKFRAQTGEGNR